MNKVHTLITALAILILCASASAIGVMPAKTIIAGGDDITFTIVNTQSIAMNAELAIEGEIAVAVLLEQSSIPFSETDADYHLSISTQPVDTPVHGYIIVTEIPLVETGQLQPRIALKHRVSIYPELPATPAETGETARPSPGAQEYSAALESLTDQTESSPVETVTEFFTEVPRESPNPPSLSDVAVSLAISSILAISLVFSVSRFGRREQA